MFLKKNTKNLRSILTVLTLFGLGLTGFFWAANSSAQSGDSTARSRQIQNRPEAVYPGTGVGAIPDNAPTGPLVVSFAVSGLTGPPTNVSVDMTLTHTWVGDLIVTLNAPNGAASQVVYSRVGSTTATGTGDSSNLGGTYTFSDQAAGNFWTEATLGTTDYILRPGEYRSSAPLTGAATSLSAPFVGLTAAQANGTWTMTFSDNAATDIGTVTAANLNILTGGATPVPTPTPTATPTPIPGALQDGGFEQNTDTRN